MDNDYLIKKPPLQALFLFALPMIIGTLFQQTYTNNGGLCHQDVMSVSILGSSREPLHARIFYLRLPWR